MIKQTSSKRFGVPGLLAWPTFSAAQDVLRRVDKTFKAFFRRVKAGLKAGYPRFKSSRRFDSYTFRVMAMAVD